MNLKAVINTNHTPLIFNYLSRSLLLILIGIAASMSLKSYAFDNENLNGTKQKQQILIVGDSLSAGYGLNQDTGWVYLLTQQLANTHPNWEIINASISGDTTSGGLRRLPPLLKKYHPEIIIIELGGNDGLRGFMPNITYMNLENMIKMSLKENSKVILSGIHLPPNYGQRYDKAFYSNYLKLSSQYQIPLIPFILENVGTKKELMQADGIHANEKGQPVILKNVLPYLLPLIN